MLRSYQIYTVGSDGKFKGNPKEIECDDDEEAVAKTMQAIDGHDLELWDMLISRAPARRRTEGLGCPDRRLLTDYASG
jgi:hypothetical protein